MQIERGSVGIQFAVTGEGPTVVLQTGGAGDGSMWREHLPYLTDFRVVQLDHRGRGGSARPTAVAAHAIGEYVADVVAVLDVLAVTRCGFVGYSAGAQVGYALAAGHPDRVAALVGLGATWEESPQDEEDPLIAALRSDGMASVVAAVEEEEAIKLPAWLRDQFMATDPEQFALNLQAWREWTPWPMHPQITCPTLLLAGDLEDPEHLNAVAAQQLPDATSAWLPGLGHVGAFLAAGAECERIVPFLAEALLGPVTDPIRPAGPGPSRQAEP